MFFNFHTNTFCPSSTGLDRIALISESETLRESDLIARVLQIEKIILSKLTNERVIPIIIEGHKEPNFICCILACIKNNWPFIPFELAWPEGRKKNILQQFSNYCYFKAESLSAEVFKHDSSGIQSLPESTAYVLFTSGSTGVPKGVCISRQSLLHFHDAIIALFPLDNQEVLINAALFVFDVFLFEFLLSMHYGCTLLLLNESHYQNLDRCLNYLSSHPVTFLNCTPTFAQLLCKHPGFNQKNQTNLHKIILMGEDFSVHLLNKLSERFPELEIYNGYGPTEATVICSLKKFNKSEVNQTISAGNPIGKMNFSFAENTQQGELIIEGPQLYSAYVINGKIIPRTTEKYFSGDEFQLVRDEWIFVRRKDRQYKWHGHRIEAGEIEQLVLAFPGVSQACCVLYKVTEQNSRLICFYEAEQTNIELEIKNRLKQFLPGYLLSIELFNIQHWPLNSSLKTDEKALISQYLLK